MAGGAHRARPGSRSRSDSAATRTRGDARTPGGGTRSSRAAAAAAGLGPLEAGAAGFPPRLPPPVTRPGSRGAAPAVGWGGAGPAAS